MEFLFYLLKVNVAIVFLYALHRFVFQHDTLFLVKRLVLLFSMVFVFIFPLIHLFGDWIYSLQSQSDMRIFDLGVLLPDVHPEVVITADFVAETTPRMSLFSIAISLITMLYVIGVAFFMLRFVTQIVCVLRIAYGARKETIHGIIVYVSHHDVLPFSFFGKIVISEKMHAGTELNDILLHEQTHVRQWHSIDVMLSELLCIFAWFNPAAWRLKKEMRLNLEYLADGAVIETGCDAVSYQLNLVRLSCRKNLVTITNNINFSPLKKRIMMMNKTKTKRIGIVKYFLMFPVAMALIFLSTASTNSAPSMIVGVDFEEIQFEEPQTAALQAITPQPVVPQPMASQPIMPQPATTQPIPPQSAQDDPIFVVVEKNPEFIGGVEAMLRWLSENTRYPVEAQRNGVQGRVITQFIVEKDGTISDVQAIRGVDPALDREAVRVVSAMPKWTPGTQKGEAVRVRFTLPVVFRLNSEGSSNAQQQQAQSDPVIRSQSAATDEVFVVVEEQPSFPGGPSAIQQWLSENMRYPEEAHRDGIQGRVITQFIIEKDGAVSDVQIVRGVDPLLDAEAVRVVNSMPKWNPGLQQDQAVRVRYTLPLMFRL